MDDGFGTTSVVCEFKFKVMGRTRDECIALADKFARETLDIVAGEPWLMLDDDWQRRSVQAGQPPLTLADDQGFYYEGVRKYVFTGPFLPGVRYPSHEGFRPQKQIEE